MNSTFNWRVLRCPQSKINVPFYAGFLAVLVLAVSGCESETLNGSAMPVESTEPTMSAAIGATGSELAAKPNIVVIMADDLGWGDVGYQGGDIPTPSIDALASESLQLGRFYTYPACTQTRAAFMSGQRMRTVGLLEPMPPWTDAGLPLGIETLAERLQENGYATWKVGKWHLGDHYVEQFPNQRGFDHFYGSLGGEVNYFTHTFVSALDWQRNGETIEEPGYVTHLLTGEALRLLESHPEGEPFFLDLSYTAPHTPLQAPEETLAEFAHIENERRRLYSAMVAEMDRGIEQVIDAIRNREDADRTLILFMSDNGGISMFGADNGSLKGGKASQNEGGLRVPALVSWPGEIEAGVSEQFMGIHDLFPTLLSLTGAEVPTSPNLVGENVWGALTEGETIERDEPLVFALIMPSMPGQPATYSASVIHEGWKLIALAEYYLMAPANTERYGPFRYELYNLIEDPFENQNRLQDEPAIAQQMMEMLDAVPMGEPIGFKPPPPDWTLPLLPGAEPDNGPPTRMPVVEAARQRSAALQAEAE